jgi:hypothetical protein
MARVWHCGFGLGSLATAVEVTTSSGTLSVQSTVTRPGSAAFALRVNPVNAAGFVRYHVYATDQAIVGYQRFALRIDTLPSASTTIGRFLDTGNNPTGQIRLTTAGRLQLWTASGVQVGSDSAVLTSGDGSWHVIELKTDATGAGALEARLNGTSFASGANSAQGSWSRVLIGIIGTNATADLYFADWALNDVAGTAQNSWPADGRIIYQRPAAAGDANAWAITNNAAGGTNNWTLVDETPPNDTTDFVQSGTLNAEDMYAVTASGIGAGDTVNAVLVGWRGRNNVADAVTTARLQVKKTSGGTVAQGSDLLPNSASFATNRHAEPRNYTLISHAAPDGAAWTQATLDTMQIGVKITAAGTNRIQITAIWAAVDYTPSAGGTTISPTGIASAEAFGAPTLTLAVAPTSVPSGEAHGTPGIALQVVPTGMASGEAHGQPAVHLAVAPTGVPSGEAFGAAALALAVAPIGIASAEAAGTPALSQGGTIAPAGFDSGEAFGVPALAQDGTIAPAGIASAEEFGVALLTHLLQPTGIGTGEAVSTPHLTLAITPAAIPSGEAFGAPSIAQLLAAVGIASVEVFGVPALGARIAVVAIASGEAFGLAVVTAQGLIAPAGIPSAEAFGTPAVGGGLVALPDLVGTAVVIGKLGGRAVVRDIGGAGTRATVRDGLSGTVR